jgi:hypothetical protein
LKEKSNGQEESKEESSKEESSEEEDKEESHEEENKEESGEAKESGQEEKVTRAFGLGSAQLHLMSLQRVRVG